MISFTKSAFGKSKIRSFIAVVLFEVHSRHFHQNMSGLNIGPSVALVTGASRGFGKAFALELSKNVADGSLIILSSRTAKDLEETRKSILERNPTVEVIIFTMDLSDFSTDELSEQLHKTVRGTTNYKSSIILHNAGSIGLQGQKVAAMNSIEQLKDYFNLNLFSTVNLNSIWTEVVCSQVPQNYIVNVSSLAALQPFATWGLYCSGKAARDMIFKVLAEEEKDNDAIRVLNYAPGPMDTEMVRSVMNDEGADERLRDMFKNLEKEDKFVKADESAAKLFGLILQNEFQSGAHVDFFD